ncbi:MAG: hypothetical protein GF335_01160 [Candidatus Moranbacteria bacterium]|nr:hypothetical protein [Candidatus Moranbacteria bacterium]
MNHENMESQSTMEEGKCPQEELRKDKAELIEKYKENPMDLIELFVKIKKNTNLQEQDLKNLEQKIVSVIKSIDDQREDDGKIRLFGDRDNLSIETILEKYIIEDTVIASNRLSVNIHYDGSELRSSPGGGGLITGLKPVLAGNNVNWVGWPGPVTTQNLGEEFIENYLQNLPFDGIKLGGVLLSEEELNEFYLTSSNKYLWMLMHQPLPGFENYSVETEDLEKAWNTYQTVNEKFVDQINNRKGRRAWIHDYQLMLVPDQLRKSGYQKPIGYFHHIPFPPVGELTTDDKVKYNKQFIEGILGADLIGFHTETYRKNFFDSVQFFFSDVEISNNIIKLDNREIEVGVFPIGVDPEQFSSEGFEERSKEIREELGKENILMCAGRLDPIKNFPGTLAGYYEFLKNNPDKASDTGLILSCVPSRTEIDIYQEEYQKVNRWINQINEKFPASIKYFSGIPQEEIPAYYLASNVHLNTSKRDGYLLMVDEAALAADINNPSVLIVGENVGAAEYLGDSVLVVDSNNALAIGNAINEALSMDPDLKKQKLRQLQRQAREKNARKWANDFLYRLEQLK